MGRSGGGGSDELLLLFDISQFICIYIYVYIYIHIQSIPSNRKTTANHTCTASISLFLTMKDLCNFVCTSIIAHETRPHTPNACWQNNDVQRALTYISPCAGTNLFGIEWRAQECATAHLLRCTGTHLGPRSATTHEHVALAVT